MKFKLFGLYWDFTPVFLFFGILWILWCIAGAVIVMGSTAGMVFWVVSVIVTLALAPTFNKWIKDD